MQTDDIVKKVLGEVLHLGARAQTLELSTQLLGSIPELDSMAVVAIITLLEERLEIHVEDDEISAETFATVAALVEFAQHKLGQSKPEQ